MRTCNEVLGRVVTIWLHSYDSCLCFLPQEIKIYRDAYPDVGTEYQKGIFVY